jgi:hypothetical protein
VSADLQTATTPQAWDKARIISLIETADRMILYRMLRALYARQTWLEQAAQVTNTHNGVGLTAFDAEFLSSVAEQASKYKTLTECQAAVVRRRLRKYARQLAEIANENIQKMMVSQRARRITKQQV